MAAYFAGLDIGADDAGWVVGGLAVWVGFKGGFNGVPVVWCGWKVKTCVVKAGFLVCFEALKR